VSGFTLELDQLSAGYDRAPVVRELTLNVAPREVVALIGANGAGKTTTLRTISGLVKPMAGCVRLDGEDLAGISALRNLGGRRAGLLSGGEQQMLAIARALSRCPRLLLLDELSLGLAPVIVERLLPVVREFASTRGTAVLLIEQHVQLALEIADRGYVLSHGELVASDSAERLRADSALLTASYLGESQAAADSH
jgi:branched-chain amino acid transport system ATP-binding protein